MVGTDLLIYSNPETDFWEEEDDDDDDDDYDWEIEPVKSKKRRKRVAKNPRGTDLTMVLMVVAAVVGAWKLFRKEWIWESLNIGRQKRLAIAEAQRIAIARASAKDGDLSIGSYRVLDQPPYGSTGERTGVIEV